MWERANWTTTSQCATLNYDHPFALSGGKVICRLSGPIGNPQKELVQISSWRSLYVWEQAHVAEGSALSVMCKSEEVRLLRAISTRPKSVIPARNRRSVYGYRRFFINSENLGEFVYCSERGICRASRRWAHAFSALWATIATTSPMEVVLAAGCHSLCHWDTTGT